MKDKDYDYDLHLCPENCFNDFVDIGGCFGAVSFMIARNNPDARIYCYEPCDQEYNNIKKNSEVYPNILPINEALGNGEKLYFEERIAGQHTFVEEGDGYSKQSRTLKKIFDANKIDINNSVYGLKIDCEGGERFLLDDEDSEEIIKKSYHFAMEIHFNTKELNRHLWFKKFPSFLRYNEWIYSNFSNSHNIKYHRSKKSGGVGTYVLTKKQTEKLVSG